MGRILAEHMQETLVLVQRLGRSSQVEECRAMVYHQERVLLDECTSVVSDDTFTSRTGSIGHAVVDAMNDARSTNFTDTGNKNHWRSLTWHRDECSAA